MDYRVIFVLCGCLSICFAGPSGPREGKKNVRQEFEDLFDEINQKVGFDRPRSQAKVKVAVQSGGQTKASAVLESTSTSSPAVNESTPSVSQEGSQQAAADNSTAAPETNSTTNASPTTQAAAQSSPASSNGNSSSSGQQPGQSQQPQPLRQSRSSEPAKESKKHSKPENDDDDDDEDTEELPPRIQPDIFGLITQMQGKVVPISCSSDADCSKLGYVCSRFLEKCVPPPKSDAPKCGPTVCSEDSHCCEGETCDTYGGILHGSRKRCRSASSKSAASPRRTIMTGQSAAAGPSQPSDVSASQKKVAHPEASVPQKKEVQPDVPTTTSKTTASSQDQQQPKIESVSSEGDENQVAFGSRQDAAQGKNVSLASGVIASSKSGYNGQSPLSNNADLEGGVEQAQGGETEAESAAREAPTEEAGKSQDQATNAQSSPALVQPPAQEVSSSQTSKGGANGQGTQVGGSVQIGSKVGSRKGSRFKFTESTYANSSSNADYGLSTY